MERVAKAIGYLVYAVASADKHVSEEEKKAVHDIVNERWQVLADQEDPFGVRALDFIDKMMLVLDEKHLNSEDAFELFKEEFLANGELFTTEIKDFIIDVCIKTGSSFNLMNKSELVLISRVEKLLRP
jgi:hypothetical protein